MVVVVRLPYFHLEEMAQTRVSDPYSTFLGAREGYVTYILDVSYVEI